MRGGAVLLSGGLVNRVVALVMASVLAHGLSVHDFGTYAFAMAAAGLVMMLSDLGLDVVTTRELASRPEADDGQILASALVAKAVMIAGAVAVGLAATLLYDSELRTVTLVATSSVLAALPSTIGLVLTARVRMLAPVVVQIVTSLATLGVVVVALWRGAGPLALVGISVAGTVVAAVALAVLGRRRLHGAMTVDRELTARLLRLSAPLAVSALGALAYRRVDQLMLGSMLDVSEVARYSNAVRLVDGLNVFPSAVAVVALPALSRLGAGPEGRVRAERLAANGYRLLAAMVLPLAALGTVVGGSALALAFGEPYRSSAPVLSVLLWAHFFGFAGVLLQQVLVARHQVGSLAALVLLSGALNITTNCYVIPRHGGLGAAWTSLAAYAAPFFVGLLVPALRDAIVTCLRASARPAAAALGILIVLVAGDASVTTTVLLFGVSAPVALVVTRSITLEELRRVLSYLRPGRTVTEGSSA